MAAGDDNCTKYNNRGIKLLLGDNKPIECLMLKNSAHDFGHFRAMIPASNFPSELHFLPTCSSKENSKMICNMHELEYVYAEVCSMYDFFCNISDFR